MIDDINVPGVDDFWKYVVDSTICLSLLQKNDSSLLQSHVNVFAKKSKGNGMELKKTERELKISFSTSNKPFYPMVINNENVEVVTVVELLPVTLSKDPKWHSHTAANTCKKLWSRLYFLRQLKLAAFPPEGLIQFYGTCIHPVIE